MTKTFSPDYPKFLERSLRIQHPETPAPERFLLSVAQHTDFLRHGTNLAHVPAETREILAQAVENYAHGLENGKADAKSLLALFKQHGLASTGHGIASAVESHYHTTLRPQTQR